mmetsp:Transcript_1704/g.2432  ORF Transcript_1704/g.2432 Transcript_1704/m.2432 type:complete len:666 (+) Transcript_1704:12-2009(+)
MMEETITKSSGAFFAYAGIGTLAILFLYSINIANASDSASTSTNTSTCKTSTIIKNTSKEMCKISHKEYPLNQWARSAISNGEAAFKDQPEVVDPNSNKNTANQKSIFIAKDFLVAASSKFMDHDILSADEDRLVKVGRSIVDLVELADVDANVDAEAKAVEEGNTNTAALDDEEVLMLGLKNVVEQCDILATDDLKVPKVRFGKTELQMPIATLGCMRFQQTWGDNIDKMDKVRPEVQENAKNIFRYSIKDLGMNHIETAFMYGSSELQIGQVLEDLYEEGVTKREDLILQTKVNPMEAPKFRETLDKSFERLRTEYLDLFSFHGINLDSQFDLIFNNPDGENLIDIVREYQKEGKIRHVGFSTHGQPEIIKKCIDTDAFDYCNLHYHYFGSYTASGGGVGGGNLENVRLMKEKDMGVFVISAYDKGGRLYAPSKKLRSLTLPELEPIQFGSLWLWYHEKMDGEHSPIHTFTVGAARPSDLDDPAIAAYQFRTKNDEMLEKVEAVTKKLDEACVEALGEDWMKSWFEGVPNCSREYVDVYQFGQIVSLYNMVQAWGMLDYGKDRYGTFDDNLAKWDFKRSVAENTAPFKMMWGYMPGIATETGKDYSELLLEVPDKNKARVAEAIEFARKYCSKKAKDDSCLDIPKEWETAYDMRPWTAFPERG